jgi:peptidoglycan-associated lipoprotein
MKTSNLLSVSFVGAALILGATGCQHGPQWLTAVPHQSYPQPPPQAETTNNNPSRGVAIVPQQENTSTGLPFDTNHNQWTDVLASGVEDRDTLKNDAVYFDFDSATIKKSEDKKLEEVAKFLQANPNDALRVEGNCDERGTEKYNLALGERRALQVREYLHNLGVDSRQVATLTFGAAKPVDPGHNEAAWKKNRRGDMVVLIPKK